MLMKNNQNQERINHFSIRKLSIGAASVLLSTTLYFGLNIQTPTAHAAETDSATQVQKQTEDEAGKDAVSTNTDAAKKSISTVNSDVQENSVSLSDSNNKNQSADAINKANDPAQENNDSQAATPDQNTKSLRTLAAQASNDDQKQPSAKVVYQSGDSIQSNGWFNVEINSGDLVNVRQGDTFQVTVGNENMGFGYNQTPLSSTAQFDVKNYGNGVYDFTAKSDFNSSNFNFGPSMSYNQPVTSDQTIEIPVNITRNGQSIYQNNIPLNVTPAPKKSSEETHPDFYYKCFGQIAGTNEIAWGAYIDYSGQEIGDLDIGLTFNGGQQVINDSIAAYTPTGSELDNGIDATSYPDAYSYDISAAIQNNNKSNNNVLKLTKDELGGKNSKQPVFVYFKTEVPGDTNEVQQSIKDNPTEYSSNVTGNISGKTINFDPQSPGETDNKNPNSDGNLHPDYKTEKQTITEIINYLEKGTDTKLEKSSTQNVTFTRTITSNSVTGVVLDEGTWTSDNPTFGDVKSPTIKGYTPDTPIVKAQTVNVTDGKFEVDGKALNNDQLVINVYYTKDAPTQVSDSKTVKETINYLEQGTNDVLHDPYTTDVTFTRTGETDAVTGETTWGDWVGPTGFDSVTSPEIDGYYTDTSVVAEQPVNADSSPVDINVYYTKKQQSNGPSLLEDDDVITETINYVYANGPKQGQQAAPTYKDAVGFTREGQTDGKTTTWGNWTPTDGSFKAVDSPEIPGYTVSEKTVQSYTVKPGDKDIEVTVYYTLIPDTTTTPEPGPKPEPTPEPHPEPGPDPKPTPNVPDAPKPHGTTPSKPKSEKPTAPKPKATAVKAKQEVEKTIATPVKSETEETLPQTGSQKNNLAFIGVVVSMLGSLLALLGFKKKEN